jgi:hypothetical protein
MMKGLRYCKICLLLLVFTCGTLHSQDTCERPDAFAFGVQPKSPAPALQRFQVSGYYRFITNVRHLQQGYTDQMKTPMNIFVGDDSQIPQLLLNLGGSVSENTRFYTDFYLWTPMSGGGMVENVKGLNLGVSLTGTHEFERGTLQVQTGGINWYALSPFTFHSNPGYNRFTVFERNPWDPMTRNAMDRYQTFYQTGALNQDTRWGRQAFQGVIAELNNLPHGLSGVMMLGKTQLNGGMMPLPNQSYGGKIRKGEGARFFSINSFNNKTYSDSLLKSELGFSIHTAEFAWNKKGWKIYGETGMGRYYSKTYNKGWGEAISLKLDVPARISGIPLQLHYFRISPRVINNSSVFWNSAIREGNTAGVQDVSQLVLAPFSSSMVPVGQLTNNRTGLELNTETEIGRLRINAGYSVARELERIATQVTYSHMVNNLALSRFWRWSFPAGVGPYANLTKVYRGVFETVDLTDVSSKNVPLNDKYFNTAEVQLKYKTRFVGKELFVNYLGTYASIQSFPSAMAVMTEKAYLRTYYHQVEAYLRISNGFVWANYAGAERVIANYQTKTDIISRRPKNQEGYAVATGFDIEMGKGAGLYLRQRWMNYRDRSFSKDQYRGWETTAEIKIFF